MKDREINRLRNILSALVNLETQINKPTNGAEHLMFSIAKTGKEKMTIRINELRQKSRGKKCTK